MKVVLLWDRKSLRLFLFLERTFPFLDHSEGLPKSRYARFLTSDLHYDLGKWKFSRGKETSPSWLCICEQPLSSSMELLFLFFIPIRLDYFPFIFYWIWKYFFEFYGCPQTILFLFQLDRMIANCFQFATLQSKEFLPLKMRYLVQV